jgi:hypothetical protein
METYIKSLHPLIFYSIISGILIIITATTNEIFFYFLYLKYAKILKFFCQYIFIQDQEYCIDNIIRYPYNLKYIKNQSDEVIQLSLIYSNFKTIIYINNKKSEILKYILKSNGNYLCYIEEEYITYELCLLALKSGLFKTLLYVPNKYKNYKLLKMAVLYNSNNIKHISSKQLTYELCYIAIKKNGSLLINIPSKFIDYNLCVEALKNQYVLKYVPEKFKDYEMCYNSVKQCSTEINYVPKHLITTELCLKVIEKNHHLIKT